MRERLTLTHEFVKFIPEILEDGVVYVSIDFATAVHVCCCGCGNKVVTPLSPRDWKLIFDGETISLRPSIGNWSFPCQSHYWITRNSVEWAGQWSDEKIATERARDARERERYFGPNNPGEICTVVPIPTPASAPRKPLWQRLKQWLERLS